MPITRSSLSQLPWRSQSHDQPPAQARATIGSLLLFMQMGSFFHVNQALCCLCLQDMLLTLMLDIVSGMVRAFRYLFVFTGLCPLSQAALVACFTYVCLSLLLTCISPLLPRHCAGMQEYIHSKNIIHGDLVRPCELFLLIS